MIHIELKNKEHSYMDAYRQIKKYIAEGKFRGLFSNVQMFVVSNAVDDSLRGVPFSTALLFCSRIYLKLFHSWSSVLISGL